MNTLKELKDLLEHHKENVENLSLSLKENLDYYNHKTLLKKETKKRYKQDLEWNKQRIKSIKKDIKEGKYKIE